MGGTVALNTAQFAALCKAIEECGMGVIKTTLTPLSNRGVGVDLQTPFGKLAFNLDQHGKRLSAPVYS
jgi:hypothetical protein